MTKFTQDVVEQLKISLFLWKYDVMNGYALTFSLIFLAFILSPNH